MASQLNVDTIVAESESAVTVNDAVDINETLNVDGVVTAATGITVTAGGITVTAGGVDLNGTELILDADADTSITADTDDQIDIRINGVDELVLTATKADNLDDLAALTPTDSNIIVGDGTNWVAESGATARTSLGLGTGNSPQFTGIELSHATENTLTAASGNLLIEGNALYRAGGTDVPVADGGTGRSTHTEYAVICGGTSTTAAQQSVVSVGTSGQVLTSAGAGALPTFTNAPGSITILAEATALSSTSTVVGSIPAGTKRVVIAISGASTNGTGNLQIRIGDSGGIESATYLSEIMGISTGSAPYCNTSTDGFRCTSTGLQAGDVASLIAVLTLVNSATNVWMCSGYGISNYAGTNYGETFFGYHDGLDSALTQIAVVTDGTDTFDAGTVTVTYEA